MGRSRGALLALAAVAATVAILRNTGGANAELEQAAVRHGRGRGRVGKSRSGEGKNSRGDEWRRILEDRPERKSERTQTQKLRDLIEHDRSILPTGQLAGDADDVVPLQVQDMADQERRSVAEVQVAEAEVSLCCVLPWMRVFIPHAGAQVQAAKRMVRLKKEIWQAAEDRVRVEKGR